MAGWRSCLSGLQRQAEVKLPLEQTYLLHISTPYKSPQDTDQPGTEVVMASESQSTPGRTPIVPVEQFVKSLSESGLLPAEEIPSLLAKSSDAQRQNTRQLAPELVRQQKLTPSQAVML